MKKQTITCIFIVTMLATGIFCGKAFADTETRPSPRDRQGRMEMNPEKRLEVMAERLDLTETQQKQIRAIHEQERAEHEETRQQINEGREEMRQLLEAETFDEAAIRELAASQASLKTEMLVSRARVKHQVFQILSPEQQSLSREMRPFMQKQRGRKHRGAEF